MDEYPDTWPDVIAGLLVLHLERGDYDVPTILDLTAELVRAVSHDL